MLPNSKIEYIAEGIDRVITIDLGARGVIYKLYDAARQLLGYPLVLVAAKRIIEAINEGDVVIITSGFRIPPRYIQETDGPPGVAALARILSLNFNAKPLILIEEESKEIFTSALTGIGMNVTEDTNEFFNKLGNVLIKPFPKEKEKANEESQKILDKYKPSLLISIEKAGRNDKGEYHTMRGFNISAQHIKIEALVERAKEQGILTIGIGDGGNEVGMGNIKTTVEEYVPNAKMCQCPCKGGIAAESKVDILVVAAVSNWGAYGIEACISCLTNKVNMHTPELEDSVLKNIIRAGAIDGVTGKNEPSVDGIPEQFHLAIISMLNKIISK